MGRRVIGSLGAAFLALLLTGVLLAGCTAAPPQLLSNDADLRLVQDPATGDVFESLRFFVAVRDDDGAEDVAAVYLVHDESELYWSLEQSEWVSAEVQGDQWYGSPDLRMPAGEHFPRGRYRILVEDRAMTRDSGSLTITDPVLVPEEVVFPSLSGSGDLLRVDAEGEVTIWVYDRTGRSVQSRRVTSGLLPESFLSGVSGRRGLDAYVLTDDGRRPRLVSGPYAISTP